MSKERSLHNYQCGAKILGNIAERVNQQPIPDPVINSWRIILSTIRLADIQIDSIKDGVKRTEEADLAIQALNNNGQYETNDEDLNYYFGELKNLLNQLPHERKQLFIKYLKRAIKVGEKVKETTNPVDK
jgi:hypothetical protein